MGNPKQGVIEDITPCPESSIKLYFRVVLPLKENLNFVFRFFVCFCTGEMSHKYINEDSVTGPHTATQWPLTMRLSSYDDIEWFM